ncbi:histone family protein DNA-binding protein [Paraburkholderia hospita]|jgi:hypothetical protein|uniref:Histone family protein DNA-binding protein n=1 Tax=Paraburkholderia hospita TaxID=169430 RepID=A0ABN0F5W7_9BURK|nr:histone family protein DNA-binding protein [Paraburkholderia hospita]EIM93887.1 histone family protein DNA-binding protein [Paraburkholderia hospita]OUL80616.1 hypothetical protein CA602_27775 [Paraburkholderia hospita]
MNKQELIEAVVAGTGESKASMGANIDVIVEAVTAAGRAQRVDLADDRPPVVEAPSIREQWRQHFSR